MKKIKNLLLIILIVFVCPIIVKADAIPLDYSYDRLAKLGNEAQYAFNIGSLGDYEFFVEYDKQYLKFERYQGISYDLCGIDDITAKDNNGKITIKQKKGCHYGVTLFFTTLKEGTTKLEVTGGTNTVFLGEPINISTEIINTNKTCEKCPEVKECEKCPEINESSKSSSDNIVLYVALGLLVILNIVTTILTLKSNKLNKKSTE